MRHVPNRPALFLVTALALSFLLSGCSGTSEGPVEQANESVAEAGGAIEEHNRLFEEARGTYEEARDAIESEGEDGSGEAEQQQVAQARETMQEARDSLEEAREPLAEVQNLEVSAEVEEYARLLSDTLDAQLAAESREIEFYEILEDDPALSEERDRAEELLTEIDEGYERARGSYAEARELAEANPELLSES